MLCDHHVEWLIAPQPAPERQHSWTVEQWYIRTPITHTHRLVHWSLGGHLVSPVQGFLPLSVQWALESLPPPLATVTALKFDLCPNWFAATNRPAGWPIEICLVHRLHYDTLSVLVDVTNCPRQVAKWTKSLCPNKGKLNLAQAALNRPSDNWNLFALCP